MHKMAEPAALAAIAAQNQGKFWQMHDALFAAGTITKESIQTAAVSTGLNMEQFNKDVANPATKQKLYKDMADAKKADITGTPTLFINGHRVKNRSPQAMQELINREMEARK